VVHNPKHPMDPDIVEYKMQGNYETHYNFYIARIGLIKRRVA
jgi:hypothetical protein